MMKISTICRYVLVVICLLISTGLKAQEVQLTLNVTPWNLNSLLGTQKDLVTDLTLIGQINANDVGTIRTMAKLTKINLAGVSLVAGGSFYVNRSISVVANQIPDYMFFSLNSLTSVVLPNSVTTIGNQSFQDCSSLTSVVIGSSVTSIGSFGFGNCLALASITIPASVTTIGSHAFWSCSALTSVTIPPSVTVIGNGAFALCTGLKSFVVLTTNPIFSSLDGVLFNKDQSLLIFYPNSKSTFYTIPASVKSVGDYAFESCSALSSVVIGNNVTSVGEGAFYNCNGLMTVSIGNSVTSIGKDVFYNCYRLTAVTIPNSVLSIGWDAFGYCTGLTSLNMGDNVMTIDIYALTNCTGLNNITIPASVTSIGEWALSYCTGLTELHCKSLTPPTATTSSFYGINKTTCKLYIPKGTTASYKGAIGWSDFKSFIEENGTSVPQTDTRDIKVYAMQDAIVVENADIGDEISVYNASGALIYRTRVTDDITRIYVPANHIYLIKITSKTFKVAL